MRACSALGLASVLVAAACGDPLVPTLVAGSYELRSFDDAALPAVLYLTPTDTVQVSGWALALRRDGSFREEVRFVLSSRASGVRRDSLATEVGEYRVEGSQVSLFFDFCRDVPVCALISYAPVEYRWSGRFLRSEGPGARVFERIGGATAP